jgi:Protein of unknown function (DUF2630)
MPDDQDVLSNIQTLAAEEHALYERHTAGSGLSDEEQRRMRELEVQLDQCWDLLRQRRARREFGEDPSEAQARDAGTVEGYRQ